MELANFLTLISIIVDVGLAIFVFFLARWLNQESEERQKKYSTLIWINACFTAIDDAVGEKIKIEKEYYEGEEQFDYSTIKKDKLLEKPVFTILNQYTAVGLAAQEKLIDIDTLKKLRGKALTETWENYEDYVKAYDHATGHKGAWSNFGKLAEEIRLENKLKRSRKSKR